MIKSINILTIIFAMGMLLFGIQTLSAGPKPRALSATSSQVGNSPIDTLDDRNFEPHLANHEIIIVDFTSDWCSPCKRLAPVYEHVAKEMRNSLAFGKLNIDHAPQVCKKYHVSSIPTLIIFKRGKEMKRRTGECNEQTLKAFIRSVL